MLKGHSLYQFGEFTLDPVARVLFRNGEPVHMTRRTAETLLVLVENAGQVLTKEEIMRAVWTDRVVDEANLAQNIAVIRKTLGVAKGTAGWIETFPGRGYRLQGPVVAESAPAAVPAGVPAAVVPAQLPEVPVDGSDPAALVRAPLPVVETVKRREIPAEDGSNHASENGRSGMQGTPHYAAALAEPQISIWLRRPLLTASLVTFFVLAGFTSWYAATRKPALRAPVAEAFQVKPVTRLQGREYQPALSRDGTQLAFLWTDDSSNAPSVWANSRTAPTPKRVSMVQAHHSSPVWSPDGTQLAYLRISKDRTEVVIGSPQQGSERVLTSLPSANYGFDQRLMDWSADGKLLAVSHSETQGLPPGIWLISAENGSARQLTRPGSSATGDMDPRFSPDGTKITFLRILHRSLQEVFVVPTVGASEPRQITRFGYRISSHAWLADGETLLLASDQTGEYRLWKYPANGQGSPTPAGIYSEFPVQLSVARDAGSLVYATLHQDRNIWQLDLQGKSWRRIVATSAQDASPVYSPDGKRIAFRSDRSGEEQIWVSSADGSEPTQVTSGQDRPSVGRWSPDSRVLVFNNPRTFQISLASEEGGRWTVRPIGARGVHPVFAPDGKSILAGGSRLTRVPVASGKQETLAGFRAEALAASADGRFVYFVREPNATALWRLELKPGTEPERVIDQLLPGCSSCWSLTKDGIYYLGPRPEVLDRQAIYFRSFSQKRPDRLVAEYPEPLWPHGSGPFSLSPNGRNLLVVRVSPSAGDIMRVEGFR